MLKHFSDQLTDRPFRKGTELLKNDENFLCSIELKEHDIELYLIYHPFNPLYFFYYKESLLFSGQDFKPSPLHDWDSMVCILSLLSFFLTKETDGSSDLFEGFNDQQMAFVKLDHDQLRILVDDVITSDDDHYRDEALKYFKPFYFV